MIKKTVFIFIIGLFSFSIARGQINPATNFIGVDVSTQPQNASFNYDSCFALGRNLGMSRVGLFQTWTAIETSPLVYNFSILDIANIYYPAYNMPVDLTIAPIATNKLEVPSDLITKAFNDSILINRFKKLLDSIKVHIPNITLSSLIIGSESDIYFGTNAKLWSQYTTFYSSVSAYAKTLWPGLKVATELTFTGLTSQNTFAQTLNLISDYIGISYYPLNTNFTVKPVSTIPTDFAILVDLYSSKPLWFYQYGYPSSSTCNSSEAQQAQFISQTFTSWDNYASNIKMIDFTWLHDLDTAKVNFYARYYGIKDTVFLEYLHTLGLRTWNGKDKAAFIELECQAKKRGYNNLNIHCSTGIEEMKNVNANSLKLFPNPAQDYLNIQSSFNFKNAEATIRNSLGQIVKSISNINGMNIHIETNDFANGLYFIIIQNVNRQMTNKFIIEK